MKIIDQLFRSNLFNNPNQVNRASGQRSVEDGFSALKKSNVEGMDKVESLLRKLDHPVSEAETTSIENFMKTGSGSTQSKLDTIEWAADKGIEMTDKNLSAIQESLNSEMNEAEMLETLSGAKEVLDEKLTGKQAEDILEKIKADPTIPEPMKQAIEKAVESGLPIEKAVVRAVKTMIKANVDVKGQTVFLEKTPGEKPCVCLNINDLLEAVSKALTAMENGASGSFETLLKESLVDVLGMAELENLSLIFTGDLEASVEGAEQGLEGLEGLEGVENEVDEKDLDTDEEIRAFEQEMIERLEASFDEVMGAMMDQMTDDMVAASSDIRFKQFLVTKVTAQAIEAKETFNQVRKEIVQSLRDLEPPKSPQEKLDMKEVLTKAIDKLDNTLMKSDVTLFTSMKMERDLLNMSSTLQEARKLLSKGDLTQAMDITKNVQKKLDQMVFKPAEKNIQLMAMKNGMDVLNVKPNMMPSINWQDTSPRGVLELFRDLGLNHEPEVAEKLLSHDKSMARDENYKIKDNLKAVLMKMVENEEPDNRRAVAAAEKTLNNLTGQQLMNKLETKQDTQTLFFHIPVQADGEIKDMKLFVNARKNGDALDWENSSLYFSVDLKKYGETGIHLQSKDKLLSITVRNDNQAFEGVMKPLVTALQKEFVDVGYKLGPVSFSNLDKKTPKEVVKPIEVDKVKVKPQSPVKEKGFDFSI